MIKLKDQQQDSIAHLTSADGMNIQPGDTIHTSHHGSNGTFLKCFVVKEDAQGKPHIYNITWHVAYALGRKPKDKDGEWMLHNPVYGMDRGFDVVYNLSRALFRDMDTDEVSKLSSDSIGYETSDAGYLLHQRWL